MTTQLNGLHGPDIMIVTVNLPRKQLYIILRGYWAGTPENYDKCHDSALPFQIRNEDLSFMGKNT
jgi:hypothetical protein